MSTNSDLMMAVLSMDAYGTKAKNDQIGNATVISVSDPALASTTGFQAVAYSYNGQTIITYRGTVLDNSGAMKWADITNGWTLGTGLAGLMANL